MRKQAGSFPRSCQRIPTPSRVVEAWLGVNVTRYAFIVKRFHSLLSTDFNRRFRSDPKHPVHRGVTNEARNVAIYLTRLLRRDSLKETGKEFNVSNYSSVSSIIEKMRVLRTTKKDERPDLLVVWKNLKLHWRRNNETSFLQKKLSKTTKVLLTLKLQDPVDKQLTALLKDIRYPSLNVKKYDKKLDLWQLRVSRDYRLYFLIDNDTYVIITIKKHPK